MFKDSQVTRLAPFVCVEEAAAAPAVLYPALVGSGMLAVGLDATGFQALSDGLGPHIRPHFAPFHYCQADTYLLHDGMISAHLWDDEERQTGMMSTERPEVGEQVRRNFLPLGWLDFEVAVDEQRWHGDALRPLIRAWRRDWRLDRGTLTTAYDLYLQGQQLCRIEIEAFAPFDGESLYFRLRRTACATACGEIRLSVSLRLTTRGGLPIFDQPGAVTVDGPTLRATIDEGSRYAPAEPYTVVYGLGVAGMHATCTTAGWTATLAGDAGLPAEGWMRVAAHRLVGQAQREATERAASLKEQAAQASAASFRAARDAHARAVAAFWDQVAEIAVDAAGDELETRRAWTLHMSEWLLRCGNDHRLGGTVQFMLMHQNGWKACNFHDHRYIIDGILRANYHELALAHVRWLHRVMAPHGRPFPWMMTYDGFTPVPPAQDRAPMSDANRAILAAMVYELSGAGRDELLRDTVYPIVRRVADHGVADWFYQSDEGTVRFRAVENDVMNETPRECEPGTVALYLSVLRKALAYAQTLQVDAERCQAWRQVLAHMALPRVDDRYAAWLGAPADQVVSPWFAGAAYIAEWEPTSDVAAYRRTCDHYDTHAAPINRPWLQALTASRMIRLDQPERAEQQLVDNVRHGLHGPGYFEECLPVGIAALPPFATAHGAHLTAACEQLVQPDFWTDRLWIGRGLPAAMRAHRIQFHGLRANKGVLVAGHYSPHSWVVTLTGTGCPLTLECLLRLPAAVSTRLVVTLDDAPVTWAYAGEFIVLCVPLGSRQSRCLRLAAD
jgi:hypothetical protein